MKHMKNYIVIILFLGIWCVCCFSSCTKDPWVYDTSRKSGIYMLDTRDSNKVIFGIYTDTNWISGVVDLYTIGAVSYTHLDVYKRQNGFRPF